MLIKSADDPSKRTRLLEELLQSDRLHQDQRQWLNKELQRLRIGHQGEQSAAHYLDMHYLDAQNHAVLHDLRLSADGQTAQIDHLIISRGWHFYLLETKNFGGNLRINEQGEFSVEYSGGKEYGIESPIEQSRRHEIVLRKVLEQLGLQGRTGQAHEFHHVVLLHPRATISRPKSKSFDTSKVIKADQFKSWHDTFSEKGVGTAQMFKAMLNIMSSDTLRHSAEMLARQHRPTDPLELPEWMAPRAPIAASAPVIPASPTSNADKDIVKKLICATCSIKISYAEGKFCWNNKQRFGGLQYCRAHQTLK
jgi:hypothetical protein